MFYLDTRNTSEIPLKVSRRDHGKMASELQNNGEIDFERRSLISSNNSYGISPAKTRPNYKST